MTMTPWSNISANCGTSVVVVVVVAAWFGASLTNTKMIALRVERRDDDVDEA